MGDSDLRNIIMHLGAPTEQVHVESQGKMTFDWDEIEHFCVVPQLDEGDLDYPTFDIDKLEVVRKTIKDNDYEESIGELVIDEESDALDLKTSVKSESSPMSKSERFDKTDTEEDILKFERSASKNVNSKCNQESKEQLKDRHLEKVLEAQVNIDTYVTENDDEVNIIGEKINTVRPSTVCSFCKKFYDTPYALQQHIRAQHAQNVIVLLHAYNDERKSKIAKILTILGQSPTCRTVEKEPLKGKLEGSNQSSETSDKTVLPLKLRMKKSSTSEFPLLEASLTSPVASISNGNPTSIARNVQLRPRPYQTLSSIKNQTPRTYQDIEKDKGSNLIHTLRNFRKKSVLLPKQRSTSNREKGKRPTLTPVFKNDGFNYPCIECDMVFHFSNLYHYRSHMAQFHGRHFCCECRHLFPDEGTFIRHRSTCSALIMKKSQAFSKLSLTSRNVLPGS